MLQRTPTYVSALPGGDPAADALRAHLPAGLAHRSSAPRTSLHHAGLLPVLPAPPRARQAAAAQGALHAAAATPAVDEHFTPPYDPWDQRLCVPGRRPVPGRRSRARRRGDRHDRHASPGRASGSSSGADARGRHRRHRNGAAAAADRRHDADRGRRAGRPRRAVRLPGDDAQRGAELRRSASATPTRRGRCAPTWSREYVCRLLEPHGPPRLAHGAPVRRRPGRRGRCSTSPPATSSGRSTGSPSRAAATRGRCARTTWSTGSPCPGPTSAAT